MQTVAPGESVYWLLVLSDLSPPHDRGLVPLHNACSYGHYEVAELLVVHGAVVNVADLWKFTPLHEAAAKGKYEICKLLLQVRRLYLAGDHCAWQYQGSPHGGTSKVP